MVDSKPSTIEQRIEWLIPLLGALLVLVAGVAWGNRYAEGAAMGAALCWINYRWLRQSAGAVIRLGAAQAGAETVRVPRKLHVKFFGRFVLLVAAVYAILVWLRLPVVPVLCGLVVVIPAIVLELLYELARGDHRSGVL